MPTLPQVSCDINDVAAIPPDPVDNVQITFQQVIPQSDESAMDATDRITRVIIVTLRYTWTAPQFPGEGITRYQAWLERRPAPRGQSQNLHLIRRDATSDELQATFDESNPNFTLYFQASLAINFLLPPSSSLYCYILHLCFIDRFVLLVPTLRVNGVSHSHSTY